MKAILIKILSESSMKGTRLQLRVDQHKPVTEQYNYTGFEKQALAMAQAFVATHWEHCQITGSGQLYNGDYVFTIA